MKHWKTLTVLLGVIGFLIFVATDARSDVSGSAHDLTASGLVSGFDASFTETAICAPCHTPHIDPSQSPQPVLWNHVVTDEGSYTLRAGQTINGTESQTCLSCHDGITGVDNYGGSTTTPGSYTVIGSLTGGPGNGDIGTDMRRQHPVGITYTPGGDFRTVATAESAGVKITQNDGNDTVECTSCHDPHDTTRTFFLRADNDTSQLCTGCHIK